MPTDAMLTDDTKRMACPNQETLARYLGGWVDDDQSSSIDDHLETCETCQAAIVRIESEPDSMLDSVKLIASGRTSGQSDQPVEPEVKYAMSLLKRLSNSRDSKHGLDAVGRDCVNGFASELPASFPDKAIGPYQLIRSLGHGGMGSVYLAEHRQLKKLVAIKVLPSRWLSSDIHLNRFQREIRAAGGLNHPSIVTATDAGQQDDTHYLVMEYIEGCDLSRVARLCGPLAIADACEAIRRVALGLSHAHSLGIVHRDIKPSNLMLSITGDVKILDFGLARHSLWDEASAELTTVGQLMGTLDYMAPEQAECAAAVDYRADLYSLGATLFRLLAGRPPLAAAPDLSPLSKLKLLASHDSPRVDTLRDDVPKDLANFIALLLHRDPSRRPASAAHVAEKLEAFAGGNDLTKLAVDTKTKDKANPPHAEGDKPRLPAKPNMTNSRGGIGRWRWLVFTAGFAAMFFAGIFLIIETQKGQLVIESDAENVSVRLLSDGKQYDTIKVQSGATATKLFAGKYEIEIEGASDELLIDQDSVIIRKGETILAKIGRPLKPTASQPETANLVAEPVYDGEPLSVWLNRIATEKSPEPLYKAMQAVKKLVEPTNAEQVRSSMMNIMATVADQDLKAGNTTTSLDYQILQIISDSFQDNENFFDYIVNELRESDESLRERIYRQLIRVDQTSANPLINYLINDVFPTEDDPKTTRLAANYARNYLLLNRDSKEGIHQNLATLIYANKQLGIDFWLEYLPSENFFGYAQNMQQRAIEALESDELSDELVTKAAIILTELHKGIGPVQVALSSDDKVRVANRTASLLDRIAERPAEIEKLVTLDRSFANFGMPRHLSTPYIIGDINRGQTTSSFQASLALELLELAETAAQHAITDASVSRVMEATIKPSLNVGLQLNPMLSRQRSGVVLFIWPSLSLEQFGGSSREVKRLPIDKADLLAYLINAAGYYALSDTGKTHAQDDYLLRLAEFKTENLLAELDQDGDGMLSKEESAMDDSEFQAYDQNGDGMLTKDEIREFQSSHPIPGEPQAQSDDAVSFDQATLQYAKRIFERYDTNKDGLLNVSEWSKMPVDPSAADTNRDGRITVGEYALYLRNRQGR